MIQSRWVASWPGIRDWQRNPNLFGVLTRKGPWLDMPFIFGELHLATPRLQRVLDAVAPRHIQWLPFRLREPYGKQIARKYAIANYLELRDVIDRKKSELEPGEKCALIPLEDSRFVLYS